MSMDSNVMGMLEDKFDEIWEENKDLRFEEVEKLVMEWWECWENWNFENFCWPTSQGIGWLGIKQGSNKEREKYVEKDLSD